MVLNLGLPFQVDTLRLVLVHPKARPYIKFLDSKFFDLQEHALMAQLIKAYFETYHKTPNKTSLITYIDMQLTDQLATMDNAVVDRVRATVDEIYEPLQHDMDFMWTHLVDFFKRKAIRDVFVTYADQIYGNPDQAFYDKVYTAMSKVKAIGADDLTFEPGQWLFKDFSPDRARVKQAHPTYLAGLNKMTAAGGFKTPELIILAAAPKGFKTGTAINVAYDYAKQGLNVFYADTENGVQAVIDRFRQTLLRCEWGPLYRGEKDRALGLLNPLASSLGGDVRVEFFAPRHATLNDVEAKLDELADEGWYPDVIIYDYLDNFESEKGIKERRLAIQDVYFHAIRINSKWETFAFSPSQVGKAANGAERITATDFAEDYGKAANAHASFSVNRTEMEQLAKVGRILPMMQRQGQQAAHATPCYIFINEATQVLDEIDVETYEELMAAAEAAAQEEEDYGGSPGVKMPKMGGSLPMDDVTDD